MAKTPRDDIKYLESRLKKNPNSILFARLADAYISIDRIDDAIQACENGLRSHPYYVTGHYIISRCYLKKKQYDHAEKELKRVLLFDPEYIAAHRDYGELMSQIGWNSSCEHSYEIIQAIDPLNKQAAERIRQIRENLQLDEDAEKEFDSQPDEFDEEDALAQDQDTDFDTPDVEQTVQNTEASSGEDFDTFEDLFAGEEEGEEKEGKSPEADDVIFGENEYSPEETNQASIPEKEEEKTEDEEEVTYDQEDEKFTYILDDIFREDEIDTKSADESAPEESDNLPQPSEEEVPDKDPDEEIDDISEFTLDEIDQVTADSEDEEMFTPADQEPGAGVDEDIDESTVDNLDKWLDTFKEDADESQPEKSLQHEQDQSEETVPYESGSKKKEKIVTPTLGEIYAAQHQYAKAIGVYEILKKNNPENPMYEQKIEYLKRKLEESQDD